MYDAFKELANFKERERGYMGVKFSIFKIEKKIFKDRNGADIYQYTITAPGMWKVLAQESYDYYENDHAELIEEVAYYVRDYFEKLGYQLEEELLNVIRS